MQIQIYTPEHLETADDIVEIERMVADFVKGHPAENHPRSRDALRAAFFGEHPVAHLLVAERRNEIVGMAQWRLIFDMLARSRDRAPTAGQRARARASGLEQRTRGTEH